VKTLALGLALLLFAAASSAGDDADDHRKAPEPTYESPVLSLLFLPVNVLIKMASVFSPGDGTKPSRDSSRTQPTSK